jgi:HK97 family phage major capsid protein
MKPQLIPGRRGLIAVRADVSDPKTMLAELQRAWEAFKAEHADEVKALKKGQEDVVHSDKVERINANVTALQAAIDQMNIKLAAAELGAGKPQIADREYSTAFAAYFRRQAINAALDKGAATEGGYTAPVEWDRTITDRLVIISPMRQIASVQQISTTGFTKLFNSRGMGSGWVGETAVRPETAAPTFGSLTFTPGEIYANPSATQGLLDDSQVDIEKFIADNVETEFAYQEGIAFVSGNGTNKPYGFLTFATGAANAAVHPWGAIAVTTAASATVIATDEVLTLQYALPSEYSGQARYVMNRATQGAIRKLKDGQGNYIWQPTFQAGQPATLAGFPVTEMAAMPNVATGAIPLAFGDFKSGYLIVDRMGVRVLRDPFTNKPYVMFYTTKRVGGGLLNPDVIKVLKMA